MRTQVFALVLPLLACALPAFAQSRYGPASTIAPAPVMSAPGGRTLTWPGKTAAEASAGTADANRPEPLSDWARRQAAQPPAPQPVLAPPPTAATQLALAQAAPAPVRPQMVAAAPVQTTALPPPAVAAAPVAPVTQTPLAGPPPTQTAALAPRPYPGYRVPQLQAYPGYAAGSAPPAPPPAPALPRGEAITLPSVPAGAALADNPANTIIPVPARDGGRT